MLPMSKALDNLNSDTFEVRRTAVHSIYERTTFARDEFNVCLSRLFDAPTINTLGAIYYVLECRGVSLLSYLSRNTSTAILDRYSVERWKSPVWTFSDYVAWEAAMCTGFRRPPKAAFIVPEYECLSSLHLLWFVLTGGWAFMEVCDECESTFLLRSLFDHYEVLVAQELLRTRGFRSPLGVCCVHVLVSALDPAIIGTWCEEAFGKDSCSKEWKWASSIRGKLLSRLSVDFDIDQFVALEGGLAGPSS